MGIDFVRKEGQEGALSPSRIVIVIENRRVEPRIEADTEAAEYRTLELHRRIAPLLRALDLVVEAMP